MVIISLKLHFHSFIRYNSNKSRKKKLRPFQDFKDSQDFQGFQGFQFFHKQLIVLRYI